MADETPDRRVDELRQRLRALGYLDAGVDRFVLGPARGTRKPAAIALLASLRVGLIAAVLLGPAAAIGVGRRLPGLVTGPRDAIVIALYLGALFGAGISGLAFAASVLAGLLPGERVADRARPLARAAGAIVTVACLAYLTLWWRTTNAGFGGHLLSAPLSTGFALAVAVGISLLLGHAVRVTASAVMVARRGGRTDGPALPSSPLSSWRMSLAGGVLAFAGAAALLILTAPNDSRGEAATPLTVVSAGFRVRLIAIDGFDPGVFDELARTGRVPSLAAAFSSAHARLAAEQPGSAPGAAENPRDPARVWTTIATGQTPEVHGVHGLETRRVAGLQGSVPSGQPSGLGGTIRAATDLIRLTRPGIASGHERREKTIWEVASEAGLRTVVVNWWATWPADAGDVSPARAAALEDPASSRGPQALPPASAKASAHNIVLSDRATLRLERGGTLDAEIAPASVYERLRPQWPAIRQSAAARAAEALTPVASNDAGVRAVLQRSSELDVIQLALAREIATPAPDLLAVYLPGLDIAQHALLGAGNGGLAPSAVAMRVDALREYYAFLDRLLAGLLTPAGNEVVVLVTQPGRVTAAVEGMLGLRGPAANTGAAVAGRSTEIMPTVLHLLGVPISAELVSPPLTGLLSAEFLRRYPVREVASYGRPSVKTANREGQPLDQEVIDRLRSLGYLR